MVVVVVVEPYAVVVVPDDVSLVPLGPPLALVALTLDVPLAYGPVVVGPGSNHCLADSTLAYSLVEAVVGHVACSMAAVVDAAGDAVVVVVDQAFGHSRPFDRKASFGELHADEAAVVEYQTVVVGLVVAFHVTLGAYSDTD